MQNLIAVFLLGCNIQSVSDDTITYIKCLSNDNTLECEYNEDDKLLVIRRVNGLGRIVSEKSFKANTQMTAANFIKNQYYVS